MEQHKLNQENKIAAAILKNASYKVIQIKSDQ